MTDFNQNFYTYQNDSELINFYITRSAAALNITGASFRWAVARNKEDAEVQSTVLVKTSASGISITSATGGMVQVQINSGDLVQSGTFYHHLRMDLATVIDTVSEGQVTINPTGAMT